MRHEALVHPHADAERAELYHSFDGGATEIEVLNFINALVYLFKPALALESGTAQGHGALAIGEAMLSNGFGVLHTVDLDPSASQRAQTNIARWNANLQDRVEFHVCSTLDLVASWNGPPFEFAFFDSLVEIRHLEFRALMDRGLLSRGAICAFHDTSRLRHEYYHDSNSEMIAILDSFDRQAQRLECEFSRGFRLFRVP